MKISHELPTNFVSLDSKTKLEALRQLEIQIKLEESRQRRRELLKDATIEVADDWFIVHNCKHNWKVKEGGDCYIPRSQTLISKDFWICHPCCSNAYDFAMEWLLCA